MNSSTRRLKSLTAIVAFTALLTLRAPGELEVLNVKALVLEGAATTGHYDVLLRNSSERPATGQVLAGPFKSETTGQEIGAQITFAEGTGPAASYLDLKDLPAGSVKAVKIEVANLWEAGESSATLSFMVRGKTETLGTLKVEKDRVPLDVKLGDKAELTLVPGEMGEIVLHNNDGMTYPLRCELAMGHHSVAGVTRLILPPHSSGTFKFYPPATWFPSSLATWFKEAAEPARLRVRFDPPSTVGEPDRPSLEIPLTLRLREHSPTAVAFWDNTLIFLLLLLGASASLALHYGLPNRLKRIGLKTQLTQLQTRVRRLTCQLESRARVMAEVQCRRWIQVLDAEWSLSPEAQSSFATAADGIALLGRRVALLEQIDALYDRVAKLLPEAPPTLLDQICDLLDEATGHLTKIDLMAKDLDDALKSIGAALACLDALGSADAKFAGELAARVRTLAAAKAATPATYESFEQELHALFESLTDANKDAANIQPNMYRELDIHTSALGFIGDLVSHRPAPGAGEAMDRYEESQRLLVSLLKRENCEALKQARLVLRQWREGIFESDVIAALQAQQLRIVTGSPVISANELVQMEVSFAQPALNMSAARQEIDCQWDFGDTLAEDGWEVSHYFPKPNPYTVQVSFTNSAGATLLDATNAPLRCTRELLVRREAGRKWDRTATEAVRFGIVFLATLAALMAGARDQLLRLDLAAAMIAIVGLGFTADAVKNMLTEPAK